MEAVEESFIASKSEMEVNEKLENENPTEPSSTAGVEDNEEDSSGDEEEEDEDEEDEEEAPDDGHPRLIQSASRTNSEKSHAPPKSAALLSSGSNDVYEFQSSPEADNSRPVKKFGKVGPSSAKRMKEQSPIEEEGSRLQIDEDEDDEQEAPKRKVPPLKITLPMKTASDEDATRDGEEKEEELEVEAAEPVVKKSTRGRKPTVNSARRVTRSRVAKEPAEDEDGPYAGRRNKPWRRANSSLIGNAPHDDEYDYALSPGIGGDEDSQEAEQRQLLPPVPPPIRAYEMIQEDSFKGNKKLWGLIVDKWKEDFIKEKEAAPEEPEIVNYDYYMINTKDYFDKTSKYRPEMPRLKSKMNPQVKDIYLDQLKTRRLKQSEQEKERNRLQMFGEREYLRALKNLVVRERSQVSTMRMLRDAEACNPIVYDSFRAEPDAPSMIPETAEEVLQKNKWMARSLFNKHKMENQTLQLLQKDELEKALKNWGIISPEKEIEMKAIPCVRIISVDFTYLTEEIKDPDASAIRVNGIEKDKATRDESNNEIKNGEIAMDLN